MIRAGEIYMANFGPAGPHPVIVTSRETLNRGRYALVSRSVCPGSEPEQQAGEYGCRDKCPEDEDACHA